MAEQTGVIRWQEDHSLCITVDDAISGAGAHLKALNSKYSRWDVDKSVGSIKLTYAGDQLFLTVGSAGVKSGSALVLTTESVSPWDFSTKPGFILWRGKSLAIDVQGRQANGVIWLYDFNGSPAQQWSFMPYDMAIAEMKSEKAHAHV